MPSIAVSGDDTDGRGANRLSGIFSLHHSPSIQSIQSLLGGLGKKRTSQCCVCVCLPAGCLCSLQLVPLCVHMYLQCSYNVGGPQIYQW